MLVEYSSHKKTLQAANILLISFYFLFNVCLITASAWKSNNSVSPTNTSSNIILDEELADHIQECTYRQKIKSSQLTYDANKEVQAGNNQKPDSSIQKAAVSNENKEDKVVYLTFDDGPSKNVTPLILDTLKKYNVKATFFVIGSMVLNNKELIEREFNEGHSVGNHTYSHKYDYLYSSPENLLSEINQCDKDIKAVLPGYNEKLFRFPGGSSELKQALKDSVVKSGYTYVDWNCLTGDSDGINLPVEKLVNEFKSTALNKNPLIILMHDSSSKETTAESLPQIIEYLQSQGFTFKIFN